MLDDVQTLHTERFEFLALHLELSAQCLFTLAGLARLRLDHSLEHADAPVDSLQPFEDLTEHVSEQHRSSGDGPAR